MCKMVTGKNSSKRKRGDGRGFRLRCGSGLCVGVRQVRRARQEWSQASAQFWGSFLCRLMGNTGARVTIGGIHILPGWAYLHFPPMVGHWLAHPWFGAQGGFTAQPIPILEKQLRPASPPPAPSSRALKLSPSSPRWTPTSRGKRRGSWVSIPSFGA